MKNWWYYHKWYVICGILLCSISFRLIGNAFGWFQKKPDVQIAYAGEALLPEDTAAAIKKAFASLADDYNQDGQVLVQLNQYISGNSGDTSAEAAEYHQAAELALTADINDCESYFFLLEDPETFQKQYQILAMPDGTCPDPSDISVGSKTARLETIEPLAELDLGNYTTTLLGEKNTGSNWELLSSLYLGRRCFYDERKTDNEEGCAALWDILTQKETP